MDEQQLIARTRAVLLDWLRQELQHSTHAPSNEMHWPPRNGGPGGPDTPEYAARRLVRAASLKQVAANMVPGHEKTQLEATANTMIEDILDNWCPTKPKPWPPHPHILDLISEVELTASTLQGGLRDIASGLATTIANRALGGEIVTGGIAREAAVNR